MTTAYYSTVLDRPADEVWGMIRDFGQYAWAGSAFASTIEDGLTGTTVGAVRRIGDSGLRQRLLAHSDRDRSYTYEFVGEHDYPVTDFVATIHVLPVIDGDRSFVEWIAHFETADPRRWEADFSRRFAGWLDSLERRTRS